MRILHLINTTNPAYGGPVEFVAQLGSYLDGLGIHVEVAASADPPDAPWIPQYPIRVHGLGPGLGKFGFSPRFKRWLCANGRSYDFWIINGIWQYQSYSGSSIARKLRVPYLVYPHGALDPWSRRAHPIKYIKKFIYWLLVEKWVLRNAMAVCFTAEEEARLATQYFPFASWNSYTVGAGISYPPHVPTEALKQFRRRFSLLEGKRIWLYLSRIHPKKGLNLLLRSFAKVSSTNEGIHLLIAGPGSSDYVREMRGLVQRLGISEKVTFTGALYGEEKWMSYKLAELFILPSHQENFGIVVAEALATGLPVCISNKINIWREIANSKAGLVCEDSERSLTNSLEKWISLSANVRNEYATRALQCFEGNFHIRISGARLLSILQAIQSP